MRPPKIADAPERDGLREAGELEIGRLKALAIWHCPDHITGYANAPGPNRLFSCREAQGTSAELLEVGDLSRRENKSDKAVIGLI